MGAKLVWAMSNFAVFICMAATAILSLVSTNEDNIARQHVLGGNNTVKAAALVIFSVLGFPLAVSTNTQRHKLDAPIKWIIIHVFCTMLHDRLHTVCPSL